MEQIKARVSRDFGPLMRMNYQSKSVVTACTCMCACVHVCHSLIFLSCLSTVWPLLNLINFLIIPNKLRYDDC